MNALQSRIEKLEELANGREVVLSTREEENIRRREEQRDPKQDEVLKKRATATMDHALGQPGRS